jgi:hypothetical protein
MIITLGRNKPNGKTTVVVEEIDNKVYLNSYKQKNGFSSFDKLVESIELDDERVNSIVEFYKRLK